MKTKIAILDYSSMFYLLIFDKSQCFHDNCAFHALVREIAFYAPLFMK